MNELYLGALRVMWRKLPIIIAVTVVAGLLAVAKELVYPPTFTAEKMLLVTGMTQAGERETVVASDLIPSPLSPKAYEYMLRSNSVLGQTVRRLDKEGFWGEDGPPVLNDFRESLSVDIEVVDETSRPINYSPLIRITAKGDTEEEAIKIVNTWADVSVEVAQRAASVRVGAPAAMLTIQRGENEKTLEAVWDEMREETALWNVDVIQKELDARILLLNTFTENKVTVERQMAVAEEKLRLIKADLTTLLQGERERYSTVTGGLRDRMAEEMTLANVEAISEELTMQLEVSITLDKKQLDLGREIKGLEEKLATVRESLTAEPQLLELGRAPSETAYWIAGSGNPKSLTDLPGKVMVSQELNPVHLELRKTETEVMASLTQKKAELAMVEAQRETARAREAELRAEYGTHKMTQGQISADLQAEESLYSKVWTEEKLILIKQEREALLEKKGAEVELAALDRQIDSINVEVAALKKDLAEHTVAQTRLKTRESLAIEIYKDIARTESQTAAAFGVAGGTAGQDRPVGLNRMSQETFAVEDRGTLGRKGRVMLTTILAFLLISLYMYARHEGVPRLRAWIEV
ncbi:MAG: hypothetical protein GX580_17370 [Candidatus Hydrogenedens sp.]|nr:hypothetical protein [Candidatus Hydrogenedentota bacterium]NLF59399.1 hypothetical protein [Candidatus Hydrogenedens sp.]